MSMCILQARKRIVPLLVPPVTSWQECHGALLVAPVIYEDLSRGLVERRCEDPFEILSQVTCMILYRS